ncbi:MAG: hypothetical protein P0116_04320 [Candidatus Nitrosocosmicus sp.]|nr:hypothetical protein [Candidatus Nitrosocosmicus sp.]
MMTKPVVTNFNDYLNKNNQTSVDGLMTFSLVPSQNGSMAMGGTMNHNANEFRDEYFFEFQYEKEIKRLIF